MAGVEDAIGRVPLFVNLSKRDLKSLAASMKERTFPAGTVITEAGENGIGFFIIDSGTASVIVAGKPVGTLGTGDHFGEIALIDHGPRTATVTAESDLRCYGLTAWDFRPFVQSHPDVAWALLETLAQLLRDAQKA
ncbi:MAG: cyclic nucleotide-binding domain-containing protein [Acidimicrobiales bacterium]